MLFYLYGREKCDILLTADKLRRKNSPVAIGFCAGWLLSSDEICGKIGWSEENEEGLFETKRARRKR